MNNEHSVAIVSFEGALKREIKRVRNKLKLTEQVSEFNLTITARGRVNDGDVRLSFMLSPSTYGGSSVEGRELNAVVEEFLRRNGWQKNNDPIAIGYEKIPSDETDNEIPY